jgi:hypothetical protein
MGLLLKVPVDAAALGTAGMTGGAAVYPQIVLTGLLITPGDPG